MTTTPTRRAPPSPGRGGHPPVERVIPGKNRATIIAIQLLIQSEEHVADLAETLLCAERDDPSRDIHAQTHIRLIRLQYYVEHADMAAGVRHRLRQESMHMQDLIYMTLLHELETSRIWQAYVQKRERATLQQKRGGCN